MNNQFNYATFVELFLKRDEERETVAISQHPPPVSVPSEAARPESPVSLHP